jgi:hypothetical protein
MMDPLHVLLVAADRHARALVVQAIDATGRVRLTVAESPGEARTLLNAHRYGLVIATNLGIPPWLAIDVVPVDRQYEAMFIGGYWEDDFVRECEVRRLRCVRVPCSFDTLRDEIANALAAASDRRDAADTMGPRQGFVEAGTLAETNEDRGPETETAVTRAGFDIGPDVLDFLFAAMKIDGAWSVREPRSFTWWGHRLAQRIWAEPVRTSHDHHIVRIHAETAVIRDVPDGREMRVGLAAMNVFMHLGALTWSSETRRISLHSAACFHAGNRQWLQPLFLAAVGLQAADAHIKADGLARLLGGEPDVSAHPTSGVRGEPDDILNVIASLFAPRGADASPWTEADFKAAADMKPRPWVLANGDATGLTAEFPFSGDMPAIAAGRAETTLLTASSTERHPQLGSGLHLRLQLPFNLPKDQGSEVAFALNLLEAAETTNTHTLGAWCLGPVLPGRTDTHSVIFASFVPAAAYRRGLLDVLAMDMAIRARWVARISLGDTGIRASTPEQVAEALRRAASTENLEHLRKAYRAGSYAVATETAELVTEASKTKDLWGTRPRKDEVQCWACRAPLTVTAETRGKKVRCPRCGRTQALPR